MVSQTPYIPLSPCPAWHSSACWRPGEGRGPEDVPPAREEDPGGCTSGSRGLTARTPPRGSPFLEKAQISGLVTVLPDSPSATLGLRVSGPPAYLARPQVSSGRGPPPRAGVPPDSHAGHTHLGVQVPGLGRVQGQSTNSPSCGTSVTWLMVPEGGFPVCHILCHTLRPAGPRLASQACALSLAASELDSEIPGDHSPTPAHNPTRPPPGWPPPVLGPPVCSLAAPCYQQGTHTGSPAGKGPSQS